LADQPAEKRLDFSQQMDTDIGGILELLDVVITPAKKEQTVEEAPSIITVIKAWEIEENGYRSVAEALRTVPGLYVRDDLIHPNASMRGVDAGLRAWSRHIKVMINGQPVAYRGDTSNWLGPELIAMDAISRIEVIRGPGSALYGANAFLGVINIITKEGQDAEWARASVGSGVLLTPCCASLVAGHSLELTPTRRLDFLLSTTLQVADRSGLQLPATSPHFTASGPKFFADADSDIADIVSRDDTETAIGAFGRVSLTDARHGKLSLEAHYTEFSRHGEFTDWGVLTHDNRVGMRNWYVLSRYTRQLRALPMELKAHASLAGGGYTDRNHLQIARDNTFWVKKIGGYLGLDLSAELAYNATRDLIFIVGCTLTNDFHDLPSIYSVDVDDGSELPSYLLDDVHFINFGSFGQVLYSPIERLSLIAGVSYETHNVYGECSLDSCPGLNPRLGASLSARRT
jgi:iron complex outermembrane receptor protein